jgi:hypothetical protein
MPKRTQEHPESASAIREGCPTLVLSPEATLAGGSRVSVRAEEGEEIADLRAWVRRYVALVIEADAVAKACEP